MEPVIVFGLALGGLDH
ncbi:hypothetical protein LINGRAHAP2_LOCUS34045 [Linum grandiflorum]